MLRWASAPVGRSTENVSDGANAPSGPNNDNDFGRDPAPEAALPIPSPSLILRRLSGLQDYHATWEAMRAFTAARDAATPDEIWLLEHPPVFTLG